MSEEHAKYAIDTTSQDEVCDHLPTKIKAKEICKIVCEYLAPPQPVKTGYACDPYQRLSPEQKLFFAIFRRNMLDLATHHTCLEAANHLRDEDCSFLNVQGLDNSWILRLVRQIGIDLDKIHALTKPNYTARMLRKSKIVRRK